MVIKYGTFTKETEGAPAQEATEEERRYLKAYTVFDASQIDGIDYPKPEPFPYFTPSQQCDRAREIIAAMPQQPAIKEGMAIPFYRPSTDSVHMLERGNFDREESYYSTLFHELAHATGHQSRLARKSLIENKGFDSPAKPERFMLRRSLSRK